MGQAFLYGNSGGGVKSTEKTIKVICSLTQPTSPKQNDVWLEVDSNIAVKVANKYPSTISNNQVLVLKINSKFINKAPISVSKNLEIAVDELPYTKPSNTPLIMETAFFEFYSELSHVLKKDSTGAWEGINGYWYNNNQWVQFSSKNRKILFTDSTNKALVASDSIKYHTQSPEFISVDTSTKTRYGFFIEPYSKKIFSHISKTQSIEMYDYELNLIETFENVAIPNITNANKVQIIYYEVDTGYAIIVVGTIVYEYNLKTKTQISSKQLSTFLVNPKIFFPKTKTCVFTYWGNGTAGDTFAYNFSTGTQKNLSNMHGFGMGTILDEKRNVLISVLQNSNNENFIVTHDASTFAHISSVKITVNGTYDLNLIIQPDDDHIIIKNKSANLEKLALVDATSIWTKSLGNSYISNKGELNTVYSITNRTDSSDKDYIIITDSDGGQVKRLHGVTTFTTGSIVQQLGYLE